MKLDLLYSQTFDKSYQEFLNNAISSFKENTGKALIYKRNVIAQTLNETFKAIDLKMVGHGHYIPDVYTQDLLRAFNNNRNDYETTPVTFFIAEHLEQIKERNKDLGHAIPQNIRLSPQKTVEFLARYKALALFLHRLDSINQGDTIEICESKLSIDGYKPTTLPASQPIEELQGQTKDKTDSNVERKEYTLNRQFLAIKYLLIQSGFKELHVDKTKWAEFVRFLTGRQPNAKHIKNTTLYDRVRSDSPENVDDLLFIRKFFIDLKLPEIVRLMDEEISSSGKQR